MVAAATDDRRDRRGLRRGARGRYAPPPQLFPLALVELTERPDIPYVVERDPDGTYLIRQRDTSRLIARTGDPATLQRLLLTLTGGR